MLNAKYFLSFACMVALVGLIACGGKGLAPAPAPQPSSGTAPYGLVIRSASGLPTAIQLTWIAQADAAAYNIYKSATTIPDSARGNAGLQVASGVVGTALLDDFGAADPVIGETWFYRLTAEDAEGDESRLSPELSLTITQHAPKSTDKAAAAPGEQVVISGDNFGIYNAAIDRVLVPTVVWVPGVGFGPETLTPVALATPDWTPTAITITLPDGFVGGQLAVEINGLQALTPVVANSAPYIRTLTSSGPTAVSGDVTHTVTLTGGNFGAAQDATHFVRMGGQDILTPGNYPPGTWTDTQLQFQPANLLNFITHPVQVSNGGVLSNTGFLDLLNALPTASATPDKTAGSAPLTVIFDASASTDPEGTTLTYSWDFGDASPVNVGAAPIVTHKYSVPGAFLAVLTVTDQDGGVSAAAPAITINVTPPVPIVSVASTPGEIGENFSVTLTANAMPSPPATTIVQIDWDVDGDGTFEVINGGATQNPTYPDHGVFRPAARATDDLGGVGVSTDGVVKVWSASDLSGTALLPPVRFVKATVVNGHPAVAFILPAAAAPGGQVMYLRSTDAAGYMWTNNPVPVANSLVLNVADDTLDLIDTGACPAVVYGEGDNLMFNAATDRDGAAPWIAPATPAANLNGGMRDAALLMVNGNPAVGFAGPRATGEVGYARAVGPAGGVWNPQFLFPELGVNSIDLAIVDGQPAVAYCQPGNTLYRRSNDASGDTLGAWTAAANVDATGGFTALALTEIVSPFTAARLPLVAMLSNGTDVLTTAAFTTDFLAKDATNTAQTGVINGALDLMFVGQRPCLAFGDGQIFGDLNKVVYTRGTTFNAANWGPKVPIFDVTTGGTSVSVTPFLNAGAVAYVNQDDDLIFSREPDAAPLAYLIVDTIGFTPPPVTVNFDATGSNDPDGAIVDVQWQLQDARGLFSAGVGAGAFTQQATYNATGNYNCFVRIVDSSGQTATATVTIVVL
jgi:hypothetical protein